MSWKRERAGLGWQVKAPSGSLVKHWKEVRREVYDENEMKCVFPAHYRHSIKVLHK
jgi:hypothetical protein